MLTEGTRYIADIQLFAIKGSNGSEAGIRQGLLLARSGSS